LPHEAREIGEVTAALAVLALGIAAGAMLAEEMVLVPYWQSLPASEFLRWFAANEPRLVAFYGPLEFAAVAFTLVATVTYAVRRRRGTGWLVLSSALVMGVLAVYPMYFQTVNARFVAGAIDASEVATELARWRTWQWLRVSLGVGAFIAALAALLPAAAERRTRPS
jgi:hypothetical protein